MQPSTTEVYVWHGLYYALAALSALGSLWLVLVLPFSKYTRSRSSTVLFWVIALFHLGLAVLYTPWAFTDRLYKGAFERYEVATTNDLQNSFIIGVRGSVKCDQSSSTQYLMWRFSPLSLSLSFACVRSSTSNDRSIATSDAVLCSSLRSSLCALVLASAFRGVIGGERSFKAEIFKCFCFYLRELKTITVNETTIVRCEKSREEWQKWYSIIVAFCGAFVLTTIADVLAVIVAVKYFKRYSPHSSTIFRKVMLRVTACKSK